MIYKNLIKLIITVFLLLLVFSRVEVGLLWLNIKELSLPALALILLFSLSSIALAARRSQISIQEKAFTRISLWESYKYYLMGMFYNNLLPTSIGGDLFRIYLLEKKAGHIYRVSSTVFIERLSGLLLTLFLALFSALILYTNQNSIYILYLSGFLLFSCIIILLLFSPSFLLLLKRKSSILALQKLLQIIERFLTAVQEYRHNPRLIGQILFLSLLYQLSDILVAYCLGLIIGIEVNFLYFLFFIPLLYIITLLPVSINGLGLRENTLVYLFSTIGTASHKALLLSLLIYLDRLVKGLVGALLLLAATQLNQQRNELN